MWLRMAKIVRRNRQGLPVPCTAEPATPLPAESCPIWRIVARFCEGVVEHGQRSSCVGRRRCPAYRITQFSVHPGAVPMFKSVRIRPRGNHARSRTPSRCRFEPVRRARWIRSTKTDYDDDPCAYRTRAISSVLPRPDGPAMATGARNRSGSGFRSSRSRSEHRESRPAFQPGHVPRFRHRSDRRK